MSRPSDSPFADLELDDDGDSIRLLELQPGQRDSPIIIRLLVCDLTSAPPYEALSYAWGDPQKTEAIQIESSASVLGSSTQLHVTTSCVAALRRLRLAEATRILWIDAICIDQTHVPERNHQLTLMTRIYCTASRVVVFLGEKDQEDGSDAVMDWLQDLHAPSDNDGKPQRPNRDVIQCFLQRRWFTRVWVIQEIRVAKAAIVICGTKQIPWDAFQQLRYIVNNSRRAEPLPYTVKSLVSSNSDSLWRPSYLQRLLYLLEDTRDFDASDPRDKLFAILPLLHWENQQSKGVKEIAHPSEDQSASHLLRAEYSRSTADVFTQLSKSIIEETGLSSLCNVITPAKVPNLPSWATDWSTRGIGLFRGGIRRSSMLREDPKDLDTPASWCFSDFTSPEGNITTVLITRGVLVGTIQELGELCDINNDVFPIYQWQSLCEPVHLQKSRAISELSIFEKTLFQRMTYPDVAGDAVHRVREFWVDSLDRNTYQPRKLGLIFFRLPPSERFQSENLFYTCHGRRFFITDQGELGLAPESARIGDQVMGLLGVETPFLFRPANEPRVVQLVGPCHPRELVKSLHGHEEIIIR